MPQSLSYSSLIPPNLFILLALIGVLLAWRWRRTGLALATAAVCFLYLVSTPVVAYGLIRSAEALAGMMPNTHPGSPPGAIIVFSAEFRHGAAGEKDTVGPITLERLAAAARLQRRLGLPVLVSGGWIADADDSLAAMMSAAMRNDLRVAVEWREDRSRTTYENAAFSAAILRDAGVPAAFVVTNPWHMARALWAFHAVGYPVIPAPTPERRTLSLSPEIILPQVPALRDSYLALHELIGLVWYICRYRVG